MSNEINVNQNMVVFPSAQRNQTTSGNNIDNPYAKGVVVYLDVTQTSGSGGLQIAVYGIDPASGGAYLLQASPQSPLITTVRLYSFAMYPSALDEGSYVVNGVIPRTFQIAVLHSDASNYTYSVGISLVR